MGDDDLAADELYRIAYDHAARIAEERRYGPDQREGRPATADAGEVARDIARRLGVEPDAICEAVEDALADRRPRW